MNALKISDIVHQLAIATGLSETQIGTVLQAQAALAYKLADKGYPIPGIGVLTRQERPRRSFIMQFGPEKGRKIDVPASKKVIFRVAQNAKEAMLTPGGSQQDILTVELSEDESTHED